MEFEQRLAKAIERGERISEAKARAKEQEALSEEDFKRLHSDSRLPLTEHIEHCLKRLPDHFPGFQFKTVVSDRGWGAVVSRDDVRGQRGRRDNLFSRLEVVVRPFTSAHVLELTAKGTIRNKEVFNRTHFQRLQEADTTTFSEMVDLWVLEYAELYATKK